MVLCIVVGGVSCAVAYTPETWQATGFMGSTRRGHTTTLLPNGKVLIVGGNISAELYDPTTGTFAPTIGPVVKPRGFHTATLLPDGRVLIVGGYSPEHDPDGRYSAELYDPATETFSSIISGVLPIDLYYNHTATLLFNGKVLIYGGVRSLGSGHGAYIFDPATNTFTCPGVGTPRYSHTATLLPNGKVLLVGGLAYEYSLIREAQLYDPATNTLTQTGSLITARQGHTATLLPNGKVLITAVETGTALSHAPVSSAELYDPVTGAFTATTGSVAAPRAYHTATLLPNGKVLIAGGQAAGGWSINTAELYDSAIDAFTATGVMRTACYHHAATLLPSGRVLVAGGQDSSSVPLSSAELYNPPEQGGTFSPQGDGGTRHFGYTANHLYGGIVLMEGGWAGTGQPLSEAQLYHSSTGTFTSTGTSIYPRMEHTATSLSDHEVLIVGGYGGTNGIYSQAEVYSLYAGGSSPAGVMNQARRNHTATLLTMLPYPLNTKVLIAGGRITASLKSAELYDPANRTFTYTGSMRKARYDHTATFLPNGKVLVAGGAQYGVGVTNSEELYDPATGGFTFTGSMVTPRNGHTATLLTNGKVLIAGGASSSGSTKYAEIYDPATERFTKTGPMGTSRLFHTATLLLNGNVLIAGGLDSQRPGPEILASAELYDPASGTFSYTGSMVLPRHGHTATLLPNGKVMIAGGWGNAGVTQMAEIFEATSFVDKPDLVVIDVGASPIAVPGRTIIVSDVTKNQGTGTAAASTTKYYWSRNPFYSTDDIYLGGRVIPALTAGASNSGNIALTVPISACAGTCYVIAKADGDSVVPETNETNNDMAKSIEAIRYKGGGWIAVSTFLVLIGAWYVAMLLKVRRNKAVGDGGVS